MTSTKNCGLAGVLRRRACNGITDAAGNGVDAAPLATRTKPRQSLYARHERGGTAVVAIRPRTAAASTFAPQASAALEYRIAPPTSRSIFAVFNDVFASVHSDPIAPGTFPDLTILISSACICFTCRGAV